MPNYAEVILAELFGVLTGIVVTVTLEFNQLGLAVFLLLVACVETIMGCKRLVTKYALSVGVVTGSTLVIFRGAWYIQLICFGLLSLPIFLEARVQR